MAQNIYDQPTFFEGYSKLPRSVEGLDGATEWPAMRALLPPLAGLDIADLGCGYGWFCRFAAGEGARSVLGIDLSERMLDRARAEGVSASMRYERGDLDRLELPAAAFDLVYSSLALHYVEDAGRLLAEIHRSLKPGGRLVFSTEHPIYMAPSRPGFTSDGEGRRIWPLDRYLVEGPRTTDWLADGVIKHHRTLGTTLNLLIAAGFRLDHVEEFCPTEAQIAARPELEEERDRPMFLLVAATR
ncbi:methyltransferase domain-containing protein [Mesorhizobium sp. BR1-1-16]|uniref:class I SAM-dependent methyltransferase n=1 Tax=Mesorhizobium sp. BR1-1-16 TaxID=2876653 RepID=UPI001CCC3801|nr:class I SAM-dependent methyltransferase [Mesorhizobium sp. BR1-1-16]MBZ9937179.1 methyltransferase domain-containing protein [Mesorhizobium sp. BR1-1-16]